MRTPLLMLLAMPACAASVTPNEAPSKLSACDAGPEPVSLGPVTCVTGDGGAYSLPCGTRRETTECLAQEVTPGQVADIAWWQSVDPGDCDVCGTGGATTEPCQTGQLCWVRIRGGSLDTATAIANRVEQGHCQ